MHHLGELRWVGRSTSARARQQGIGFERLDFLANLGHAVLGQQGRVVLEDFHEDAATAEGEGGAELRVLFHAQNPFAALHLLLQQHRTGRDGLQARKGFAQRSLVVDAQDHTTHVGLVRDVGGIDFGHQWVSVGTRKGQRLRQIGGAQRGRHRHAKVAQQIKVLHAGLGLRGDLQTLQPTLRHRGGHGRGGRRRALVWGRESLVLLGEMAQSPQGGFGAHQHRDACGAVACAFGGRHGVGHIAHQDHGLVRTREGCFQGHAASVREFLTVGEVGGHDQGAHLLVAGQGQHGLGDDVFAVAPVVQGVGRFDAGVEHAVELGHGGGTQGRERQPQGLSHIDDQLTLTARITAQADQTVVRAAHRHEQLGGVHHLVQAAHADHTVAFKDRVVHVGAARHGPAVRLRKHLALCTAAQFQSDDHDAFGACAPQRGQKRLGLAHRFQQQADDPGRGLIDQKVHVIGHAGGEFLTGRDGVVEAQLAQIAHDARPSRATVRHQGHVAGLIQGGKREARHLQSVFQVHKAHAIGATHRHVAGTGNGRQGLRELASVVRRTVGSAKHQGRTCLGGGGQLQVLRQGLVGDGHGHAIHRVGQCGQAGVSRQTVDVLVLGVDQKHFAFVAQGLDRQAQLFAKTAFAPTGAHDGNGARTQQSVQAVFTGSVHGVLGHFSG